MPNANYERAWQDHLRAHSPVSDDERRRLTDGYLEADVAFTHPEGEGVGRDLIVQYMADFQAKFPGFYFSTTKTYQHHGQLIAAWAMHQPDGSQVATGYNYARFNDDDRIEYIAGFFDVYDASA